MADFETAFNLTAIHEGGYSNNPADRGGETYRGISRKFYPDWSGWQSIDDRGSSCNVELLVMSFYKREFWDKLQAELLDYQPIASELFDTAANMGNFASAKMLQRAINLIRPDLLSVDGLIGRKTIEAANDLSDSDKEFVYRAQNALQAYRYITIIERDPSQSVFAKGWFQRVK